MLERLEGAGPLLLAGVGCLALGLSLRPSGSVPPVGGLQVWGLFIALGVVAWVGASVSAALDESEPSRGSMAEKKEKAAVPPRAGRSPADPEEEDAPVILPTGVVVRRRRAADADDATPLPRRRTPARAPEEAPARDDADDEPIVLTSQGIRDPTERAVDDWTPAEAIAELDQLQRDLERLRRSRRPPDS